MNSNFNLIAFLLVVTFLSCKNENTLTEFKFSDKPVVLNCDNLNSKLYHEAMYAFEDDIFKFYGKNNPNTSLVQAYSQYIRNSIYGRTTYEDIVSPHTLKVFQALKNESNLWDTNNTKSHLNYNGTLINCIAKNIENKDLKTTFNALVSTNSMSPKLFGSPLLSNYRFAMKDKYLAAYIAFDLFYAKLFDADLSKVNLEKPEPKVDFNKKPQ